MSKHRVIIIYTAVRYSLRCRAVVVIILTAWTTWTWTPPGGGEEWDVGHVFGAHDHPPPAAHVHSTGSVVNVPFEQKSVPSLLISKGTRSGFQKRIRSFSHCYGQGTRSFPRCCLFFDDSMTNFEIDFSSCMNFSKTKLQKLKTKTEPELKPSNCNYHTILSPRGKNRFLRYDSRCIYRHKIYIYLANFVYKTVQALIYARETNCK